MYTLNILGFFKLYFKCSQKQQIKKTILGKDKISKLKKHKHQAGHSLGFLLAQLVKNPACTWDLSETHKSWIGVILTRERPTHSSILGLEKFVWIVKFMRLQKSQDMTERLNFHFTSLQLSICSHNAQVRTTYTKTQQKLISEG